MKNHQKWKKNVKIVKSNFRSLGKKNFSAFGPLSFLDLVEGAPCKAPCKKKNVVTWSYDL